MKKQINPIARIKSSRGLAAKIARGLGISEPSISKWERIPAERVIAVEKISGIPREELRPDLYAGK